MQSQSRRTLLLVGSFVVVAIVTLAAGFATATAVVAHVEASTSVDAEVESIEPAADANRMQVRMSVENPTRADFEFRSAFLQVFDDEEVVADNAGVNFDRTTVPAGETESLVVTVVVSNDADPEAVREAARDGELRAAGRVEGSIVDRRFRISIEGPTDE